MAATANHTSAAGLPDAILLHARNRQIAAVHTISSLLSSTLDLDERLRDILKVSMQAVDALAGTIYLHRPEDSKLVFQYVVGPKADELMGLAIADDTGVVGSVFKTGVGKYTNHPKEHPTHRADLGESVGFVTESILTVPLKFLDGQPVGVMQMLNKHHGQFDHVDLEVLEIIGSIAATAIQNARLAREAQIAAVAHAVGDLSHDIKNKVTPISMAVYTLRPTVQTTLSDLDSISRDLSDVEKARIVEATKYLREDCDENFDIIMDQVQEIQDYTKLIADALKGSVSEPSIDPNNLGAIVARQLTSLEPVTKKSGITLNREIPELPICRFDRFLIERAVFNLVNNAIPETPSGGSITTKLEIVTDGKFPDGGYVLIEVSDTGRGMPPHVMNRILHGDAKSTKPGGTGLGTRIVYNAVLAHKGLFEGESAEGAGTTFKIKIPYLPE
ncbi:MAG: GAF domain-containing sensor histidine kinase [Chthonomonadales bacterium]